MLEAQLRKEEEEDAEFAQLIEEERASGEQEDLRSEDSEKNVVGNRIARLRFDMGHQDRRSGDEEGGCGSGDEAKEQDSGWPAMMPDSEKEWRATQSCQVVDDDERPEWLRHGILEALCDVLDKGIGKWTDREIVLARMDNNGWERWQSERLIAWVTKQGMMEEINGGSKIGKPVQGIRINGRRQCEAKTLLLTYFPQYKWDGEELKSWTEEHCQYVIAGVETCPRTGREHVHAVCDFASHKDYKWLKHVFPTINIKTDLKSRKKAVQYVVKGGQAAWELNKAGSWRLPENVPKKTSRREVAGEILKLAREGKIEEIATCYPDEYFRYHGIIQKEAANAELARLRARPKITINLREKNLFIWGDAGTGKSWLADEICGPRAYAKSQNKWWDGWDNSVYSGIIFNDLDLRQGFNWQTVLDAADVYPFHGEVKNGYTIIDPIEKPVVCTSNYSPQELFGEWIEARVEAFKRRFNIVQVQWVQWGASKMLKWTYDPKLSWRPPETKWWDAEPEQGTREHDACFMEKERTGKVPEETGSEDSIGE
jgi:hypothetical protein